MVRCAALGSIAAAENDETGTTLITWPRHRQFGWAGIVRPVVSPRAAPALSASATAAALAASRACHRPRRRPCGEMEYMSGLLGINRIGNAAALRWNPGRMRSGLGQSRGLVAGCARRGAAGIGQAKESQSRQAESSRWRRDDLLFESAGPGPGEVVAVVAQATPLVGRDADVSRLSGVLAQAGEGAGSLVLVSGRRGSARPGSARSSAAGTGGAGGGCCWAGPPRRRRRFPSRRWPTRCAGRAECAGLLQWLASVRISANA